MARSGRSYTVLVLVVYLWTACCSLYDEGDPMVILHNNTIASTIYNSEHAWIVEFYSSWCGHCHAFAPTWRRFAREVEAWDKYARIGVLDCKEEHNMDTCRDFGINSFPTVKFFNAHLVDKENKGKKMEGEKNLKRLRHALVDHVQGQTTLKEKPLFRPASPVEADKFIQKKESFSYLFLVFERSTSYIGKVLVLDTSKCKKVSVQRVLDVQGPMNKRFHVVEYPSLIRVFRNGSFQELSKENRTRKAFLAAMSKISPSITLDAFTFKARPQLESNESAANVNSSHEVYMQDIVSAVVYSLRREVPMQNLIKDDALDALKDWVNLLFQCVPASQPISKFLALLDQWLVKKTTSVKSADWTNYLEDNQKFDSYLPYKYEYRGCKGSKEIYRGYSCSLWTLFHAMTVHCSSAQSKSQLTGQTLLARIKGYIENFFLCHTCRVHFVEMAKDLQGKSLSTDEALLWLWEHHNEVNARLRTDLSSDPQHPKVQFPPPKLCQDCRHPLSSENTITTIPGHGVSVIQWNKKVTLEFLKEHYGPDNIRVKDPEGDHDLETESPDADFVRFQCPDDPIDDVIRETEVTDFRRGSILSLQ